MNNFHGISSGEPRPCSLKLKFGKASIFGRFSVGFRSCMNERESVFCINNLQATFPPNIMFFIISIIQSALKSN